MTIGPPPLCMFCRHYRQKDEGGKLACRAYPDGIPQDILDNVHDHRLPHEQDDGITFEPKNRRAAEQAADLARLLWGA